MTERIREYCDEHVGAIELFQADEQNVALLERIINDAVVCYRGGNKIIACGNGGSAADAAHFVAELVGWQEDKTRRRVALPAIDLASNVAALSAIANDQAYENVFIRQLAAHLKIGDMVFGYSTSGTSKNVVGALEFAHGYGGKTVFITGDHIRPNVLFTHHLRIPSSSTPHIQEAYFMLNHIMAHEIERNFLKEHAAAFHQLCATPANHK